LACKQQPYHLDLLARQNNSQQAARLEDSESSEDVRRMPMNPFSFPFSLVCLGPKQPDTPLATGLHAARCGSPQKVCGLREPQKWKEMMKNE